MTERKRVQKVFREPSLTKQSFRQECDINFIMRRYERTGVLPNVAVGRYGDFSGVEDFLQASLVVKEAEAQLASLPAPVRARFKNDVRSLLEFVTNEENRAEAQKLGMLKEEPVQVVAAPESDKASNHGSEATKK